jgi:single-strand DNA-binding protein
MLNVVAIRGRLSRPAEERVLPSSGERLVGLDLSVRREGQTRAESVPVVWYEAPATASNLAEGDEVIVVGHVARRFFRAGGGTQSRTEVVARCVLPVSSRKRVETALNEAIDEITVVLPTELAAAGRG